MQSDENFLREFFFTSITIYGVYFTNEINVNYSSTKIHSVQYKYVYLRLSS